MDHGDRSSSLEFSSNLEGSLRSPDLGSDPSRSSSSLGKINFFPVARKKGKSSWDSFPRLS